MTKKSFILKDIKDAKISIDQGIEAINAPKEVTREDVEFLLQNLEKVEATINARDKISYTDTNLETAIQALESILSKALEKKDLVQVQEVLSQLKNQTPGVKVDQIRNLMTKLLDLLKYANLAKPVIDQVWVTLSRYFGLG